MTLPGDTPATGHTTVTCTRMALQNGAPSQHPDPVVNTGTEVPGRSLSPEAQKPKWLQLRLSRQLNALVGNHLRYPQVSYTRPHRACPPSHVPRWYPRRPAAQA